MKRNFFMSKKMFSDPQFSLLPGEKEISKLSNITLTSKRIRQSQRNFGVADFTSISLDSLASCSLKTTTPWEFFLMALFFGIPGGFLANESPHSIMKVFTEVADSNLQISAFLFILAAFSIFLFFKKRTASFNIESSGGQCIKISLLGLKRKSIIEFINAIEEQKLTTGIPTETNAE
jgi:hypothetical protein